MCLQRQIYHLIVFDFPKRKKKMRKYSKSRHQGHSSFDYAVLKTILGLEDMKVKAPDLITYYAAILSEFRGNNALWYVYRFCFDLKCTLNLSQISFMWVYFTWLFMQRYQR